MKLRKPLATFVACILAGAIGIAIAGLISKPNTFTAGTLAKSSEVNSNFDTIYNEFNGNISDANISASAAIQQSKVSTLIADLAAKVNDTGDTITGPVNLKFAGPYLRWIGSEASAKDLRLIESAGVLVLQRNDGTEGAPTWVTVYQLPATGIPASSVDLTTKTYVDASTIGLAFQSLMYTGGDFNTSSSTFVDMTGVTLNITTGARRVRVSGSITFTDIVQATHAVDVQIDGVSIAGTGGVGSVGVFNSTNTVAFNVVSSVLTAASHTIKVRVARPSGSGTITAAANSTYNAILQVQELPI